MSEDPRDVLLEENARAMRELRAEVAKLRESLQAGRCKAKVSGKHAAELLGMTRYRFEKEVLGPGYLERVPGECKFWRHEVMEVRDWLSRGQEPRRREALAS